MGLYNHLREKESQSIFNQLSLKTRKRLHPIVLKAYALYNRLGGYSYKIIGDQRTNTTRPTIYAVTHVGKFDIQVVSEAIKDHCYVLTGDFEHLQGTGDAFALRLTGVFYFNEIIKADRQSVVQKMIAHLQQGGNLMYFPEGAWNLSPNLPLLPCYWGIIDVARNGGAIIVPIAANQYGKHFEFNIGNSFDVSLYGADDAGKAQAIDDLRDTMATLTWEIWERHPSLRAEIQAEEWDQYVEQRLKEWPGFSVPYIDGLTYRPKGITPPQEAFAHLRQLIPCKENAFLFRKNRIFKN